MSRASRVSKARVAVQQREMLEEAAMQPAVPEMESLIAQAVANNSREIELTQRAERAEQRAFADRFKVTQLQELLVAEKTAHLETAMKLIAALEEINKLTPSALAWENRE